MKALTKISMLLVLFGVSANAMANYNDYGTTSSTAVDSQYTNADRIATMTPERRAIVMERSASMVDEQKTKMKLGQETMKDRRDKIRYKRTGNL
jgi:hypothetical protein